MYSIKDLQTFIQAANSHSFVQAAAHLGLTPSAVGKIIQKIEQTHTVRLFTRNTRHISLTEEGEVLYQHAQRILSEYQAIDTIFTNMQEHYSGRLKISIPNIEELFSPLLAGFMRAYPDIQLEVCLNDDFVDIFKDGYDAVIRFGPLSDSRLFARKIGSMNMRIYHSPSYSPNQKLSQNTFLFYQFPASGKLESWETSIGISPDEVSHFKTFNSISMIKQLCLSGSGLAYLPEPLCQGAITDGKLQLFTPARAVQREITLIWPNRKQSNNKLRVFIDYVMKHWDIHSNS